MLSSGYACTVGRSHYFLTAAFFEAVLAFGAFALGDFVLGAAVFLDAEAAFFGVAFFGVAFLGAAPTFFGAAVFCINKIKRLRVECFLSL